MKEAYELAESYINGNIGLIKEHLKKCSKVELLDFIEACQSMGEKRFVMINKIRLWLE